MVNELLHMIRRCIWVEMSDSSELFRRVLFDLRISHKSEREGQERVEVYMTVNTEIGMMWPPARECWLPVEAWRSQECFLPWSLLEAALLTCWFQLCGAHLRPRILRTNLCCSKPCSQGEAVLLTTVASNLRPSHLNFLSYFICHFLRGFDVQC